MEEVKNRLLLPLVLLAALTLFGTVGYVVIEGWGVIDAVYMTVITITTVGYREVHELSKKGVIFTMGLSMVGVGMALYLLVRWMSFVLEGELVELFGRRKMERQIRQLEDHFIVCGYGRMGSVVCKELLLVGAPFVVIENDRDVIPESPGNMLFYYGDATDDEVLKAVGIERAKKLISVLASDADNLYVVLSAREMNPSLFIVTRADQEGSHAKFLSAGADRVVSAYAISGAMLAHTALRPTVVDFIRFATTAGQMDLQMEEMEISKYSRLASKSLDESGIGKQLGVIVVAIKKPDGGMRFDHT